MGLNMKCILNSNIICFIILLTHSFTIFGQGDGTNIQKYWYYKTRFNNDFIKIGTGSGESIPFNQRGDGQKGYPTSSANSATGLRTGDAIGNLGLHLAALATEYGLLKQNNQNTDSVKHEIFCALNALNRLDHITEQIPAMGGTTLPLNGFMVRDDVGINFLMKNYEHFNYYNGGKYVTNTKEGYYPIDELNDRGFCSQIQRGQTVLISSFKEIEQNQDPRKDRLMSQDHIITLMVGLNLVNKFVDYSATDNGAVFAFEGQGITSLKQESWNISDRIAQHFKNDPTWRLIDPTNNQPVSLGANTNATQYGMAEGLCRAANYSTNLPDPFIPLVNPFGSLTPFSCNYNTPYVQFTGQNAWELYMSTASTSVDNAGFKVHLLAVGNCGWKHYPVNASQTVCGWVNSTVCQNLPFPLNWVCNQVTNWVCNQIPIMVPGFLNLTENELNTHLIDPYGVEALREQQPRKYDMWHAALLHKTLFPLKNSTYNLFLPAIKGALDNAPCEGPYNFGQFARPQFEWTCESRIEKTINRQDYNEPDQGWLAYLDININNPDLKIHTKPTFKGEYNGVDYMLYHNLYRLTAPNIAASSYIDLSHRYINVPFPNPNAANCTKPSSCLIRAFETITADNTINSNADVVYKAGKVIVLKPGFNVVSGGDFYAYIQRADCSSGAAGLRTAVTDSTKGPENTFYGYDDMGDNVITHYVDYSNVKDSTREDMLSSILPGNTNQVSQTQPVILSDNAFAEGKNYFNVYPNPASDFATVEFTLNENEKAELIVMNNLGQPVAIDATSDSKKYRKTLYVGDLAKGIYLIKVSTNANRLLTKKLTIQ